MAVYLNIARLFYMVGLNGTIAGVVLVHAGQGADSLRSPAVAESRPLTCRPTHWRRVIRTAGPPIRENVVDIITRLTAPAYFACAALSMEHFMLRKIGASLSAIPADIDNGSEWSSSEQEAYFSIENTGPMTSSSASSD